LKVISSERERRGQHQLIVMIVNKEDLNTRFSNSIIGL
jgi:hypothetical protein